MSRAAIELGDRVARLSKLRLDAGVEERKAAALEDFLAFVGLACGKLLAHPLLGITATVEQQRQAVRDVIGELGRGGEGGT